MSEASIQTRAAAARRPGSAPAGLRADMALAQAMRQAVINFSQPKISYTAYPVMPSEDARFRYPHELNPNPQPPSAAGTLALSMSSRDCSRGRNLIAFIVAFVTTSLLAGEASAAKVNFTATVGQVRAGCSTAGGTFGVHADGGGYGCTKANCDGKGGTCMVHCDNNNNCTGTTPARVRATIDFMNILTNSKASPVAASPAAPGSILDGSGGFPTQRPGATGMPVGGGRPASAPQIR